MRTARFWTSTAVVLVWTVVAATRASAAVIPVGIGAFGPGSVITTFAGLADGTEVNGLTVDGIVYQYSLGNGQVVIDGGPGTTNNVNPLNIVSIGNNSGVLSLTLPSPVVTFGYGYALLGTGNILNGTTISLFNGATPVGSLSYTAMPDPAFSGGFAGLESTLAFNRIQITFNSVSTPAFALDNVRRGPAVAVPEPTTLTLLGTGVVAILARARRKARI